MTTTMGIREITRNLSVLDEYDLIEVEDKKTKKKKGAFVSAKYLNEIKKLIEKKEVQEKKKKLDEIMQFAGSFDIEDRFKDKSYSQIKKIVAMEKYGDK